MSNQLYTIILRHDTSTNWTINNPILALGEYGVEDDTHRIKRGDGETGWKDLPYETFGIALSVGFSDITGEPTDNKKLTTALDGKVDESVFEESNNKVVSDIQITEGDNVICNIVKSRIDVTGETAKVNGVDSNIFNTRIYIESDDNSIQGVWRTTTAGIKVLNLTSNLTIEDFKPLHGYRKNQLCVYENKIYRAPKDFESESRFYEDDWILLTSLNAEDINIDNTQTTLTSTNVQDIITELDTKVNDNTQQTNDRLDDVDNEITIINEQIEEINNTLEYNEYD